MGTSLWFVTTPLIILNAQCLPVASNRSTGNLQYFLRGCVNRGLKMSLWWVSVKASGLDYFNVRGGVWKLERYDKHLKEQYEISIIVRHRTLVNDWCFSVVIFLWWIFTSYDLICFLIIKNHVPILKVILFGAVKDRQKVAGGKCRLQTGAHFHACDRVKSSNDGVSSEIVVWGCFRSRAEQRTQTDGSPWLIRSNNRWRHCFLASLTKSLRLSQMVSFFSPIPSQKSLYF